MCRVQLRDALERGGLHIGNGRRLVDGPLFGALTQLLRAPRVLMQERLRDVAVREQIPVNGQRDGHVGSGFDRQVHVG